MNVAVIVPMLYRDTEPDPPKLMTKVRAIAAVAMIVGATAAHAAAPVQGCDGDQDEDPDAVFVGAFD